MSLDPHRIPLDPSNDLEGVMVQVASGVRPEAEFRRTLLEAEVFLPQVKDEEGERRVGPGEQVAMRTVDVRGIRCVPVFTSHQQLEKVVPRVSWARLPVATLRPMLPAGVGLVLNPEGDLSRLVDPLELAALPDEPGAGVERLPAGTEVRVGLPAQESPELYAAVAAACRREPAVRAAFRALFQAGDAPPRLAIGVLLAPGSDPAAVLTGLAADLRDVATDAALLVVDPAERADPVAAFMLRETDPVYTAA